MIKRLVCVKYLCWCLIFTTLGGCYTAPRFLARSVDRMGARVSFLRWNLHSTYEGALHASDCPCAAHHHNNGCARALELASRSRLDLESLMQRQPAPSLTVLDGKWCGINKGVSAAVVGITQDIKVFRTDAACPGGYNIAVEQVPLTQLPCRGFKPVVSLSNCQPKITSKFQIVSSSSPCKGLVLDYSLGGNDCLDPASHLYDELVMIDQNLLLGRANVRVGKHLTPLAYFVLFRENCQNTEAP